MVIESNVHRRIMTPSTNVLGTEPRRERVGQVRPAIEGSLMPGELHHESRQTNGRRPAPSAWCPGCLDELLVVRAQEQPQVGSPGTLPGHGEDLASVPPV